MEKTFKSVDFKSINTYVKLIFFILVANIVGSNIFIPEYFGFDLPWHIWTWSLVADIVFIFTMSISLLIPLELHARSKFFGRTAAYGILSGIMVYIGYLASWYFVCLLSDEWDLDDYSWVFYGYWGAIACMIASMLILKSTNE